MASLPLVWLLLATRVIDGSENLSRKKTTVATQSSLYRNQTASLGIDGNTAQNGPKCAHTAINRTGSAWYQIDMRNIFSIERIRIFYRNEEDMAWRPVRFRQFYLDVSNTSASNPSKRERFRCYTDNTTFPNFPSAIYYINCTQTARYIIVQTEYYAYDTRSTGPVLEICEMEIYGCVKGYWGENCSKACSTHCLGEHCNPENGNCVYGCKQYFVGKHCEECSKAHGPQCDKLCSPFCINGTCFSNNGSCKDGRNSNYNEDNRIEEIQAKRNPTKGVFYTLYGIVTIFIISVFLNIFLIVRNVRQTMPKRQSLKKVNMHFNSTSAPDTAVDLRVEEVDNAGYQELEQFNQPAHYDVLQ